MTTIQSNDVKETQNAQAGKRSNHILTILVDLSHEAFADRGVGAAINILEVLSGLSADLVRGKGASVATDGNGTPVGVLIIARDEDGQGKQAFETTVDAVTGGAANLAEAFAKAKAANEG